MYIEVMKSKIHRVTVTQANVDYVGSITIDSELLEAANIIRGEKVQVVNVTNGERLAQNSNPFHVLKFNNETPKKRNNEILLH